MMKRSTSKKFKVKVKLIELEGFHGYVEGEKVVVVEMKWKRPKVGLAVLRRTSKQRRNVVSAETVLTRGDSIKLNDEFENICSFSTFQKDNSFIPWKISFNLLYGQSKEPRNKFELMGTASLNISEMVSQWERQVERKLPIALQVDDIAGDVTLLISVSFVEIKSIQESPGVVQNLSVTDKEDGFLRKVKNLTSYVSKHKKKKKKKMKTQYDVEERVNDTDESAIFDSEDSPEIESLGYGSTIIGSTSRAPCLISANEASLVKTRLDSAPKIGSKKCLRSGKRKQEPLIDKINYNVFDRVQVGSSEYKDSLSSRTKIDEVQDLTCGRWEEKELISRDGQVKLKANVFFASIDQRSEEAGGESACTALVAVIADWLQSNQHTMPTKSQFDGLIKEGSSEWRKLCKNEGYIQCFPDKHFDLETVLQAEVRPLSLMPEKSFIGFFCPENFEFLKGAMSFDGIWDEISSNTEDWMQHIYIVSWNDHFFVLKVEENAYYIIDTLGERLFEGCRHAYILKFNDTTSMYMLSNEDGGDNRGAHDNTRKESQVLVCSGKECCREFIKRFLAAIPLKELEMEEKNGTVSSVHLHQRLQIEFHCSSASSSASSSTSSSSSSSSSSSYDREDSCI